MNDAPVILVDADACPVKEEIYKVAFRAHMRVVVVANAYLKLPEHTLIERARVGDAFDAADDFIAEAANPRAIVVTADILLADRALKKGATVIAPNGKPFTSASIGAAIATRAIMQDLRGSGDPAAAGGAKPFSKEDRSRFLQALDAAVARVMRG